MISSQFYNIRALTLAKRKARKNKRVVYLILKHDSKYYAINGVTLDSILLVPQFYDKLLLFWSGGSDEISEKFPNVTFVNIFEFLCILTELT